MIGVLPPVGLTSRMSDLPLGDALRGKPRNEAVRLDRNAIRSFE